MKEGYWKRKREAVEAFPVDTHIKAMLKRYPKGFPFERYQGFAGVLQQYAFYKETRQWQ